jgi:hypothetical protein
MDTNEKTAWQLYSYVFAKEDQTSGFCGKITILPVRFPKYSYTFGLITQGKFLPFVSTDFPIDEVLETVIKTYEVVKGLNNLSRVTHEAFIKERDEAIRVARERESKRKESEASKRERHRQNKEKKREENRERTNIAKGGNRKEASR